MDTIDRTGVILRLPDKPFGSHGVNKKFVKAKLSLLQKEKTGIPHLCLSFDASTITENGKLTDNYRDVKSIKIENEYSVYRVDPGSYIFAAVN